MYLKISPATSKVPLIQQPPHHHPASNEPPKPPTTLSEIFQKSALLCISKEKTSNVTKNPAKIFNHDVAASTDRVQKIMIKNSRRPFSSSCVHYPSFGLLRSHGRATKFDWHATAKLPQSQLRTLSSLLMVAVPNSRGSSTWQHLFCASQPAVASQSGYEQFIDGKRKFHRQPPRAYGLEKCIAKPFHNLIYDRSIRTLWQQQQPQCGCSLVPLAFFGVSSIAVSAASRSRKMPLHSMPLSGVGTMRVHGWDQR